jgi:hypothetical protein
MDDNMFKMAAGYASKGWRVLPIFGLKEDGKTCRCKAAHECGTPGKHPRDWGWPETASTDEDRIFDWFYESPESPNVGVALGETSGIIDIEWDDAEGAATAEKLGITKIDTPTYQSHRSEHRLFQFDKRLPQQAVIKIGGLEIRIGGGGRGAQSVFPPSLHASGVSYRWKYDQSPDDVDVAEIPANLMQMIVNNNGTTTAQEPARNYLHKEIKSGDRHTTMCRLIAGNLVRMLDPHDPREQQDALAVARSLNMTQCKPPLEQSEVESIWRGQLRWAIKVRSMGGGPEFLREKLDQHLSGEDEEAEAEANAGFTGSFTLSGLEFRNDEWWPGQWMLKVIHSDPVSYVLTLPAYGSGQNQTFVDVVLNAEQYRSASMVAQAVLEATHTVILDEIPEEWAVIWSGRGARKTSPAVRGLKAKLMDVARRQEAAAEALRYARVAEWFLGAITTVPAPRPGDDSGEPSAGGFPTWVKQEDGEWELWFGWSTVWEQADRGRRRILEGDQADLKRRVLAITKEDDFQTGRHVTDGGVRKRFIRWTEKHIRALERLAAGDVPTVPAPVLNLPDPVVKDRKVRKASEVVEAKT